MEHFFDPRSVVVIGASNAPFNLGATICNVLNEYLHYTGTVYVVNSKGEAVGGYPGYPSVLDLPETPDLAVIIVAARHVPGLIKDIARKGIKRIVIESAGFSESGEIGETMQREIDEIARQNGIRMLGPNCLGILSAHNKFCCFYGVNPSLVEMGRIFEAPGTISYIIQSGGVVVLALESLYYDLGGVNKAVSIGNKCDVDEAELIEYFQNDKTELIGIYLESISTGRKHMEAARKSRKPVLLYKVGKTKEGAMAAMSHTAGMANNDRIFDSACKQAGIIRLQSIDELHSLPKMFTEMPLLKGKRIAAFTNSGAFGGISADLLVQAGLQMVRLTPKTQEKLKKVGQAFNIKNPVDIGPAPPQTYLDIFEILLSADEVDGLLPLLSVWQPFVIDCLLELMKICKRYEKPAAIYTPNAIAKSIAIRAKHRIPIFETTEQAVRALAVSQTYYASLLKRNFTGEGLPYGAGVKTDHRPTGGGHEMTSKKEEEIKDLFVKSLQKGQLALSEYESRKVIASVGVPVTREALVQSRDEAMDQAKKIGFPVVLKGSSPELTHKTEMGMVRINLKDIDDVGRAFDELTGKGIKLEGVLVQEMLKGQREFVIGLTRDPHFGPCVMFGLGGIFTEAMHDVSFRVAPLTEDDAREMIGEIRAVKLLDAFRGEKAVDRELLVRALVNIGRLGMTYDEIAEIDINPLIIRDGKPVAVDALVILQAHRA